MSDHRRPREESDAVDALDEQWDALSNGANAPFTDPATARTAATLQEAGQLPAATARRIWNGTRAQAAADRERPALEPDRQTVGFLERRPRVPRLVAVAAILLALLGSSVGDWRDALRGSFPASTASAEAGSPSPTPALSSPASTSPALGSQVACTSAPATISFAEREASSPTATAIPCR